jgi:uncharacterized protein (TIGR03435 family)
MDTDLAHGHALLRLSSEGGIMRRPALLAIAILTLQGLSAQPVPNPAFEVATVKPAGPTKRACGMYTFPGGRLTTENCPLQYVIEQAFGVQSFQISGAPSWTREVSFDIDARPPASSKSSQATPSNSKLPPNDEQRRMLQALLAERFRLKYHRETKEGPVYSLTRGKKEAKLQEPKNKNDYPWAGSAGGGMPFANGIAGINISTAQLAKRLSVPLGRPVIDQTRIEGSFDFKFEYVPDDPNSDVITSILTSIQGLGLKLESLKGPVETIVVDHVERPSEN